MAGSLASLRQRARQDHAGRTEPLGTGEPIEHCTKVRVVHAAIGQPPRLQQLLPGFVNWSRVVVNTAENGQLVCPSRQLGQMFAEQHSRHAGLNAAERTANLLGSLRFGIPGLQLARSTDQIDQQAMPRGVLETRGRGDTVHAHGCRNAHGGQAAGAKEISASPG